MKMEKISSTDIRITLTSQYGDGICGTFNAEDLIRMIRAEMGENPTELKPCPFCGGEACVSSIPNCELHCKDECVTCKRCGAVAGWHPRATTDHHRAIEEWNRRVKE